MSNVDLLSKYPQWMHAQNREGVLSDTKVCYLKWGGNLFGIKLCNKTVWGRVLVVPLFLLRGNNIKIVSKFLDFQECQRVLGCVYFCTYKHL